MPQRAAPVKFTRRAARGAIHGDDQTERDAQRAEAGHAHGAYCKIFVVRINFHLHGTRQFHFVFFVVGGDDPLHLRFKVRVQKLRFFFVKPEDRVAVFEGGEILVAVKQTQAVDSLFVAETILVAHFQQLAGLVLLAETHQIDAQLRASRPETRVCLNRLAIKGDAVFVAPIQNQLIGDERVAFAVSGIDLANFFEPRIGRAVGERFDRRMDRHRVQRLGRNFQGGVGFVKGFCFVRILEQQTGHQLVCFVQFRGELDRFARVFHRLAVKTVGAHEREAVISLRIFRIAL